MWSSEVTIKLHFTCMEDTRFDTLQLRENKWMSLPAKEGRQLHISTLNLPVVYNSLASSNKRHHLIA